MTLTAAPKTSYTAKYESNTHDDPARRTLIRWLNQAASLATVDAFDFRSDSIRPV
jgi:hypothetical protein